MLDLSEAADLIWVVGLTELADLILGEDPNAVADLSAVVALIELAALISGEDQDAAAEPNAVVDLNAVAVRIAVGPPNEEADRNGLADRNVATAPNYLSRNVVQISAQVWAPISRSAQPDRDATNARAVPPGVTTFVNCLLVDQSLGAKFRFAHVFLVIASLHRRLAKQVEQLVPVDLPESRSEEQAPTLRYFDRSVWSQADAADVLHPQLQGPVAWLLSTSAASKIPLLDSICRVALYRPPHRLLAEAA